jgi:hypothetical protein
MTTIIMTNSDPIQQLSKRLKTVDEKLSKELKNYVPDWWDEELNNSPSAVQQLLMSLARYFYLDLKSVLDKTQPLKFKASVCNYKHASNKEQSQLKTATALVSSAARIVAQVTSPEFKTFPDALTLRKTLLDAGSSCINFQVLVRYCWQQGVPILYLPELPTAKKMDAVVIDISGTPVIAITKKCSYESEFLFFLAHEMGHISHGHLKTGQLLIDAEINGDFDTDRQEKQANDFAIALLTGNSKTRYDWNINNPVSLRIRAEQEAKLNKVDIGHIILNWGHSVKKFPFARKVLNELPLNTNWSDLLKTQLFEHINEDDIYEDQLDYLYKLLKIEG